MKITFIDGSESDYPKPEFAMQFATKLREKGHQVDFFKIANMKINFCNGCWSCWWKTPGECPQKDDMPEIYRSYLKSDLVLHFSPLSVGFISSKLKTINDRSVPLVHPYIQIVNGECHHQPRYEKYPAFGVIVDPVDSDSEDVSIVKELYERLTLNLKSQLKIFKTIVTIQSTFRSRV